MGRTLTSNNESGVAEKVTRPVFIAELMASTPIRISSRGDVVFNGDAYKGVGASQIQLSRDGLTGQIDWFNEDLLHGQVIANENLAGKAATVWMAYGESADLDDPDWNIEFSGVVGRTGVSENRVISIELTQQSFLYSPRYYMVPPVFRWLPVDGTEVKTPDGMLVLRKADFDF